jgi:hypothetical protein
MRLYFKRAELLLHQDSGSYVLEIAGKVLATFKSEKRALAEYNRIRRDLETKLPPAEVTDAERRALLDRYLADSLVKHNSLREEPRRKAARSRTFG